MSNETSVTIDVTAESGEKYPGKFVIRKRLTHNQKLRQDALRRELLGPSPAGAMDDVVRSSFMLAKVLAHVVEGPSWWQKAGNGLDLFDEEPITAIYNEIIKIEE